MPCASAASYRPSGGKESECNRFSICIEDVNQCPIELLYYGRKVVPHSRPIRRLVMILVLSGASHKQGLNDQSRKNLTPPCQIALRSCNILLPVTLIIPGAERVPSAVHGIGNFNRVIRN